MKKAEINTGGACLTFLYRNKKVSVAITLFYSIIAPQLAGTSLMIQNTRGRLINTVLDLRAWRRHQVFMSWGPFLSLMGADRALGNAASKWSVTVRLQLANTLACRAPRDTRHAGDSTGLKYSPAVRSNCLKEKPYRLFCPLLTFDFWICRGEEETKPTINVQFSRWTVPFAQDYSNPHFNATLHFLIYASKYFIFSNSPEVFKFLDTLMHVSVCVPVGNQNPCFLFCCFEKCS